MLTPLDLGLVGSTVALGLAGGPHCAVMCGAAQVGVARSCAGPSRAGLLALHAGRAVAYAGAGALLAAGVAWLGGAREASSALAFLWRMANVAAIGFGLWLLWRGEQPAWLAVTRAGAPRLAPVGVAFAGAGAGPSIPIVAAPAARVGPAGRWRAGVAGLGWALLPCGLLQSALVTSALASGPAGGALAMTGFAAASALSMGVAQVAWSRIAASRGGRGPWVDPRLAVRLAGALLVAAAGYALAHDIGRAMGAAWCT